MRNLRAHIAETAANFRPLVRLAGWTCMFALGAGLIHRARV
jgi:hypothetical protein